MGVRLEIGHHQASCEVPHELRGVTGLWAGVLHMAFLDATGHARAVTGWEPGTAIAKSRRDVVNDARGWIDSDARGVGAFLWICALLDLDAGVVRAQLKKKNKGITDEAGAHRRR
jgi:hypothetical protein